MKRPFPGIIALLIACRTVVGAGEVLYNGIELPAGWPPAHGELTREPLATPPYLLAPPAIIPIDVGRQLFVDDFLIEQTSLERVFHRPIYHPASPVLVPDKEWEGKGRRARAACFSDGVWFDPQDKRFKMWYWASASSENPLCYDTCLATSQDGLRWEKPVFDVVPGSNIVLRDEEPLRRNSCTAWLDLAERDPQRRYKMFRVVQEDFVEGGRKQHANRIRISFSSDGIHWRLGADTDNTGDRTTVFRNAFRSVWVFGLRDGGKEVSRCRSYAEFADALPGPKWSAANRGRGKVLWVGADKLDPDRHDLNLRRVPERPWDLVPSQLYNLDANAYESVLLGLFSIWRGHPLDRPKINEICVGFSRDGFHWTRPDRRAFCPVSERKEDWNWGNLQSAGGCCLVVGDKLYFYVGAVSGKSANWHPDPSNVGLAVLRRDGFASMDAKEREGTLTTRPVKFGGRNLFVNLAAAGGELRVEVLDPHDKVVAPFSRENCVAVQADRTLHRVAWKGAEDLSALAGQPVKFRFLLKKGSLYSFWISADASGASHGYVAAGGPGFTEVTDTVGTGAYAAAALILSSVKP